MVRNETLRRSIKQFLQVHGFDAQTILALRDEDIDKLIHLAQGSPEARFDLLLEQLELEKLHASGKR